MASRLLAVVVLLLCVASVYCWDFSGTSYADILDKTKGEVVLRTSAGKFQKKLGDYKLNIVTAESLTAGKIFGTLVDIAGFGGNKYGTFGVYDTDAKRRYLGVMVPNVYSESCARQMARGALKRSRATMSMAVTGHAAQDANGVLGHVDLAISLRTKASTKKGLEDDMTGLYGGNKLETSKVKAAKLKWGVKDYSSEMRVLDSGSYATYHIHLDICAASHGFAGTKEKCEELSIKMNEIAELRKKKAEHGKKGEKKEEGEANQAIIDKTPAMYALGQDLRDVVRRTVVYIALETGTELLHTLFDGKDVDTEIKPKFDFVPPSPHDTDDSRHQCGDPSDLIRRYLAHEVPSVPWGTGKCEELGHLPPADFELPDFLEEDTAILRHNKL